MTRRSAPKGAPNAVAAVHVSTAELAGLAAWIARAVAGDRHALLAVHAWLRARLELSR